MLRDSRQGSSGHRPPNSTTEQLIDKNIAVTKKAHEHATLQSRLRILWFVFTSIVVSIWSAVYLSAELSAKTCYVKKNADGSFAMVNYFDDGFRANDDITNVSNRFEYLTVSYLA